MNKSLSYSLVVTAVTMIAFFSSNRLSADDAPVDKTAPAPASTTAEAPPAKKETSKVPPVFTGEAKTVKDQIEVLFVQSQKVNKSGSEGSKARSAIESAVDWDRIAKDTLGQNYGKASASNREKYRNLLKQVVVKTAFSRLDTFWDGTKYSFAKIDVTGKTALVKSRFEVKDGDKIMLEYFLSKKGEKWMIYDISYEEVRYSENINEQITSYLKEGNFSGLLSKLQKRLDELDSAKNSDKS